MLYTAVLAFIIVNIWFSRHLKSDNKVRERWLFFSCLFVLALMSACRFQVGSTSDMYRNYVHAYRAYFVSWRDVLVLSPESLHQVLRKIVMTIFRDPQAYFFITAFFIHGTTLGVLSKYSNNFYICLLLYYVWGGYFSSNNITRQYIAISISLFAIKYIIEEKPLKFAVCVLLAMGFHVSVISIVPLYFLSKSKFNKNTLLLYTGLSVLLVAFNRPVVRLMQRFLYSDYGYGYGAESSNALRLIWPLLIFMFLVFMENSRYIMLPEKLLDMTDRSKELFNNLLSHGSIMYIYFSMLSAVNMLVFSRVAAYFSVYATLTISYGVNSSKSNNNRIFNIGIYLLCVLWFVTMNYAGKYIPTPYTPFWEFPWRAIPQ